MLFFQILSKMYWIIFLHSLLRCGARNASHSEGCVPHEEGTRSALRRMWSFEEGPSFRGKQEMLRARIRNPRNPPKDLVLLRSKSSSGEGPSKEFCMKKMQWNWYWVCLQITHPKSFGCVAKRKRFLSQISSSEKRNLHGERF